MALQRLPARAGAAARHVAGGLDAAAEGRPAGRAARPGRGLGEERCGQPDALVQGPGRVGRARSGARARLSDDRVRVDGQSGQRGSGSRCGRRARVVRVHPARPRGAEGARDRRLRHQPRLGERQLRRRQPPLHRAVGRTRLGVREHQHAAVLLAGVEDACLRDRRAARVRAPRPRRRPDRIGVAVHEDRARIRGMDRRRPADRRAAGVPRRPGPRLLAGRHRVRGGARLLPPGQAGHDREVAGDRQSSRWSVRARPGPAHTGARSRP